MLRLSSKINRFIKNAFCRDLRRHRSHFGQGVARNSSTTPTSSPFQTPKNRWGPVRNQKPINPGALCSQGGGVGEIEARELHAVSAPTPPQGAAHSLAFHSLIDGRRGVCTSLPHPLSQFSPRRILTCLRKIQKCMPAKLTPDLPVVNAYSCSDAYSGFGEFLYTYVYPLPVPPWAGQRPPPCLLAFSPPASGSLRPTSPRVQRAPGIQEYALSAWVLPSRIWHTICLCGCLHRVSASSKNTFEVLPARGWPRHGSGAT
jgi:hypothetical protein